MMFRLFLSFAHNWDANIICSIPTKSLYITAVVICMGLHHSSEDKHLHHLYVWIPDHLTIQYVWDYCTNYINFVQLCVIHGTCRLRFWIILTHNAFFKSYNNIWYVALPSYRSEVESEHYMPFWFSFIEKNCSFILSLSAQGGLQLV